MHISFTNHVKYRINERGISLLHIEQTLKKPDSNRIGFDGTILAQKAFAGKILEIVYTKNKGRIVVITAYYFD